MARDQMTDTGIGIESISTELAPSSISMPPAMRYHLLSEAELETLVRVGRPVQAGIAIFSGGHVLPCLIQSWPVINSLRAGEPVGGDVFWLVALAIAVVFLVVCGANAVLGKSDARKLLDQIRDREKKVSLRD